MYGVIFKILQPYKNWRQQHKKTNAVEREFYKESEIYPLKVKRTTTPQVK